jgi:hypothetical protein
VAGVDTGGVIRAQLWNGSTWSPLPINPLGTMSTSAYWGVDVAYESQSGDAVLVWGNGTTGSASLSYSVWNGSSWSAPATIAVPIAGAAHQLQLAASPISDEMVLVVSTAGSQDYALVWNGSSWGNAITLSATGTGNDRTDVYVAYEQRSGDALVVYGRGTSAVHFRTWNGTSWSGEGTLGAPAGAAGNARWATLGADATSDRIALGVLTYSGHVWLSVWSGSAWQAPVLASTSASSTTAPGVAVAFEATTGQALAVYTASGSPYTRYRTWSQAGGWSGAAVGTYVGNVPRSVMLDADPATDDIMLSIVDDGADFNLARWNGAGWSERTELSSNTLETGLQPFLFMWDRKLNAPPVLDLPGGSIDYVENDPATVLDGAATVSDSDSPDFAGGTLTVRFGANGTPDDRLELRDQGPGLGNVSLSGNVVSYDFGAGPVAIGSYTGGSDGSTPLVVTFNANATATVVQAVARSVTYRNVSDGPTTAPRTVEMVVTDGDGGTSAPAFKTVNVTGGERPSEPLGRRLLAAGEQRRRDARGHPRGRRSRPRREPRVRDHGRQRRRGLRDRPEHRRDHRGRRGGAGLRDDAELRADGAGDRLGRAHGHGGRDRDADRRERAAEPGGRGLLAAREQRERDAGRHRHRHGSRRRGHPHLRDHRRQHRWRLRDRPEQRRDHRGRCGGAGLRDDAELRA